LIRNNGETVIQSVNRRLIRATLQSDQVCKFVIGMSVSISRCLLCWALVVILPASLLAQTPSAILHAQGGVWVNNDEAKDSSALFSGDTIETKTGYSANLIMEGSGVLIQPESVTTFNGDWIELDHGGVAVETSRHFKVRVHCITVDPVLADFTQYEVTDVNGTIHVSARKKDVNVDIHKGHKPPAESTGSSQNASVHEGEDRNYDESQVCGAPARPAQARQVNPKWLEIGGGVGAAILVCVLLPCWGGPSSNQQMSQDKP
jgi:hypothetical protein